MIRRSMITCRILEIPYLDTPNFLGKWLTFSSATLVPAMEVIAGNEKRCMSEVERESI